MLTDLLDRSTLPPHMRARITLAAFVLTFIASRVLVLLIMTRRLPDLFLNVGQTHVHHLNYGIFLVCVVGAYALFAKPMGPRLLPWALRLYGIGLALTFDEFGMWLHLGGGYWQRASYDAVVVVSSLLALVAFMPSIRRFHAIHWSMAVAIVLAGLLLAALLLERLHRFGRSMGPWLENIERTGPQ
jgi:hypothetical protein